MTEWSEGIRHRKCGFFRKGKQGCPAVALDEWRFYDLNGPMKKIQMMLVRGCLTGAAVLLAACAAATPGSRVAQAPQLFEALTTPQKQAVLEGRVLEGMSPDAVYLAWGRPDRVTRGSQNGTPFELWRFTELQPVYRSAVNLGWGYGYGPYGYGGRGYYDPAFVGVETGPDYVPVTAAVVRFSRNRVIAWERLR